MANMIIRPATGTGNKVIVQDQAGAAVLTTADSGAAIESNVTNNAGVATGTIASAVTFPAGHVLQVVQSNKTDTDSVSSSTWSDIDGTDNNGSGSIFCCKITPTSTSSKILIGGSFNLGQKDGNNAAALRFLRDSTVIAIGDAAGNRERAFIHLYLANAGHHMTCVSPNFLDSPNTTSQVTYKAQFRSEGGAYTTLINRSFTDTDALVNGTRCFSNFLLMEIAG
jgi:hypothetical protein